MIIAAIGRLTMTAVRIAGEFIFERDEVVWKQSALRVLN